MISNCFCFRFQFTEALRKYPIVAILNRTCVKDYKIPGTDNVIEKGVEVFIPALAMQTDEKYYSDPEKFKPERFLGESSADKPYYPFGDGPRNCIGMRMGMMQTKVGILLMLQKFKYELKSKHDLKFNPQLFLLSPKDSIELSVIKR